jgi:hypothetical protein
MRPIKLQSSDNINHSQLSKPPKTGSQKTPAFSVKTTEKPPFRFAALGLVPDKLSAAIISFTRYFSLPMQPQMLVAIRRQALAPQALAPQVAQQVAQQAPVQQTPTQQVLDSKTSLSPETLALSLAAAESKGVELSAQALAEYASAVDPEYVITNDDSRRDQSNRKQDSDDKEDETVKKKPLSGEELKKKVTVNSPLLNILNSMPDSNGRRWIVLPFDYEENGKSFRVSFRVLLEGYTPVNMALDIAGKEQRWVFVMRNDKPPRITLYLQPSSPNVSQNTTHSTALKKELSRFLGMEQEHISVTIRETLFPCEEGDEFPAPVDEEA